MKLLSMLASVSMALGCMTAPVSPAIAAPTEAPGQNGSNAELLSLCNSLVTSGNFSDALNFGRCMSFNSTSDEGFGTAFCEYLRGESLLSDFGFVDFNDCVKNVHP